MIQIKIVKKYVETVITDKKDYGNKKYLKKMPCLYYLNHVDFWRSPHKYF
jgi:hypothetical protein